MNKTNVSSPVNSADLLERLQSLRFDMTPELRKAANYLLDSPNEIAMSSIRQLALKADVKPNSFVRLSRIMGLEGYDGLRELFRTEIRAGRETYPDKARWLQSLSEQGRLGTLFAETAAASIDNLEQFFSSTDPAAIEAAAKAIAAARHTYVLGVGVSNPVAQNFAYLAGMAIDGVSALPNGGTLPVDGLARADQQDVLIAMTFKPYRREVVDAVDVAVAQGVRVIAISDSLASPIMAEAAQRFLVPTETPQFFTSTVALTAFFEMLIAHVIAAAGETVIASIEAFHSRRHALGIYYEEEGSGT